MVVEIKDLVKRYGTQPAVDHLSLSVREGEIYGLLGPNGAGKTTLIQTLTGLLAIDGGSIHIFGKDLYAHEKEVKKDMGIVPQDIALYEALTAYENVAFFGRLYGLKGRLLKERVEEALHFTGLWERRQAYPKEFSGGMKRRLNISCGVVHHPKLIFMDEPTVGIDPQSRSLILEAVRQLNQEGSTVIYTSHYMEEVEALCHRVTIMDQGKVIACGVLDELKALVSFEDRLEIQLREPKALVMGAIEQVSGVKECLLEGDLLKVISEKNAGNLSQIIDKILQNGGDIRKINMETPSLEQVFLTLTGRSLRD